MTDDQIEAFFEREREAVPLLPAPPGRLDELQTVARRRRNRNTTVVTMAAAVVVAVGGTGVALSVGGSGGGHTADLAGPATQSLTATTAAAAKPSVNTAAPAVDPAVPHGFKAWSVTFASDQHGWALGGYPCSGGLQCIAVLETTDGTATWQNVSDPGFAAEYGVDASTAIIRFVDPRDGWMVGSQGVWATHDAGRHWQPIAALRFANIDALEAHGDYTYALGADGSNIWVSHDRSNDNTWTEVGGPGLPGTGTLRSDALQIANRTVAAVRTVGGRTTVRLSGDNGSHWSTVAVPCKTALLSLVDENTGRFVCADGRVVVTKFDGSRPNRTAATLRLSSTTSSSVVPNSVTGDSNDTVVGYTGAGIWAISLGDDSARRELKGDFGYVGLTDNYGIALSATPSGSFWRTIDSGTSWVRHSFG